MHVRLAEPSDLRYLAGVEAAADTMFVPLGITDLPPPAPPEVRAHAVALLVVGRPPVGFAELAEVDGHAHLEQLSVHPEHGRRGLGGALVTAACEQAGAAGYRRITLLTYADIPWNAPFYARHGFRILDALTPGLAALRHREVQVGLDVHGRRVAMARELG